MAEVTVVNNQDHTVTLRLDETTERGRELIEHLKKMQRREELKKVTVKADAKAGKTAKTEADS